jgi:hypothetical protein
MRLGISEIRPPRKPVATSCFRPGAVDFSAV